MTGRTLCRAVLAVCAVLALTGCVRVLADTTVHDDDTYSGRVVVAFTDAVVEQLATGLPPDVDADVPAGDLFTGAADSEEFAALQERYPGQIEILDYVEGDRTGIEVIFTHLPLEEFANTAGEITAIAGPSASVVREGDTYVVTMDTADVGDVGGQGEPGAPALPGGDIGVLESAIDFDIIYRFPGQVREANAGTVDGNTVTLGLSDVVDAGEIRIVGGANPEINWAPIVRWGLVALAFLVIVGGATALVIQDKRKRSRTNLPPPVTTSHD